MASFRNIFHVIWYAWNIRNLGQVLFVFLVGLFFLLGAAYYASRDRLSNTPESIDLDAAHRFVQGASPHHVKLSATPDFSSRIYRTGIWAPFWGNCPPDEIHELDAAETAHMDLDRLLGCRVVLSGRVNIGEARTIRWPSHAQLKDATTVSLVTVQGTRKRIWIRSEVVKGGAVNMTPWQRQTTFSGILASYPQALSALPKGLATQSRYQLPNLPNAFVICPHTPYSDESLTYFASHYWVPVKESNNLFLWTSTEAEPLFDGVIDGVLMPLSSRDYKARDRCFAHFEAVTGQALPERFGIIEYPTAEAFNRKLSGYSGIFTIFGILWVVCGLTGVVLYIVAPGIIFDAWKQALNALSIRPTKRQDKAETTKKRIGMHGKKSNSNSKDEAMAPEGYHPFMTPSSSPAEPDLPKSRVDMSAAFRTLRELDCRERQIYLTFIQDFMHPNNPDAGLVLVGCNEDMAAAEKALYRQGQRHPGLVMKTLAVNQAPLVRTKDPRPETLEDFDMRAGDYVILSHAPSVRRLQRMVVRAVFGGTSVDSLKRAETVLRAQKVFAIMGRVFLIGDSEHGPCQRMIKKFGSTLMNS